MHDASSSWVMAEWWLAAVFFPPWADQIIWTDPGEWKWVREGQAVVPCFSLPSNVIRALKEGYGLDSNPSLSLILLRHLSLSLSGLLSHQCRRLSFALFSPPSFPPAEACYCFIPPGCSSFKHHFFKNKHSQTWWPWAARRVRWVG